MQKIKQANLLSWLKKNLFSSPLNSILTIIVGYVAYQAITFLVDWSIFNAAWSGGVAACRENINGACWPLVGAKLNFFIYGFYPIDQRWRVDTLGVILFCCIIWLVIDKTPFKKQVIIFTLFIFPIIGYIFLNGNVFGINIFRPVSTSQWGGLTLTIIIGLVGIVFSLPIGVLLALGRQSELPVIKTICIVFIEFWRGVPLITVLFMASVMLPLFLGDVQVDNLIRALIGYVLFASAYMAEVVRGGLQGIPKGQYEGAESLGLSYYEKNRLIVLPQALTLVIPGIVNTFIGLFKDTTLVLIISLIDFLGAVQAGIADPKWFSYSTAYTGYFFTALVFFFFCYLMSLYSKKVERKLNISRRRN